MRLFFLTLLCTVFLFVPPAEARQSWTKPHVTKNGSYVRGHYTAHRRHLSHAPKHKKR